MELLLWNRIKKNKNFWFDYGEIWLFFESFFSMEYEEIQRVLKIWLEEDFKLKGYTPKCGRYE